MCMHALYPTSPTSICWAFADPKFGKRAQTPTAPAPRGTESDASEHISLDEAITKLKHHREADEHAREILAAAISSRSRDGSKHNVIICAWCYTPQLFINDTGTPPHYLTSAAELFYLHHLRSYAAPASGSHCTPSAVRSGACKSTVAVIVYDSYQEHAKAV